LEQQKRASDKRKGPEGDATDFSKGSALLRAFHLLRKGGREAGRKGGREGKVRYTKREDKGEREGGREGGRKTKERTFILNSIVCAEEASCEMRHSKKGTRAPA